MLNIINPSVQISSVSQSCPTLCDPMNRSTPGLPVHHQLPEFTQTHVHRVGDASSHLILCRPLLLLPPIPPSIRVFSNESTLRTRWPKFGVSASASVLPENTKDWAWCSLCQQHRGCFDFIWKLPGGSKGEETPMGDVGDHLQGLYKCANKYVEGSLHNIIYTRIQNSEQPECLSTYDWLNTCNKD